MHELNIMLEVVRQVEELAAENNLDRVMAIVLQIGELSTVVPYFLEEYYPLMIEGKPVLRDSELIIETVEGVARCKECGAEYNVIACEGRCPSCNAFAKEVLAGQEFIIKEVLIPQQRCG